MKVRSRSLVKLTQGIEQSPRRIVPRGLPCSSRFTFGHGVRGDPATRSVKRSHETLERELLTGSWVLFGILAPRIFLE